MGEPLSIGLDIDSFYCYCYHMLMSQLLTPFRGRELDLEALVRAAAILLEGMPAVPSDGRVAALPDARTLRYYQSIGLVDKPLRYAGRQAVYGYRHLLQVLAVKALQGRGLSLAQVQRALLAAPTESLEAAVAEALAGAPGAASAASTAPAAAPTSLAPPAPPHPLVAAELLPGVIVTIDPARAGDPEAILARIGQALATWKGSDR